jgi:hypothetical protein
MSRNRQRDWYQHEDRGGQQGSWQGKRQRGGDETSGWRNPCDGRDWRRDGTTSGWETCERNLGNAKRARIEPERLQVIQKQLGCHSVVFVAGEPGSGKTTGVPWELTTTFQRVACCMPRRLQAKMAAIHVRQQQCRPGNQDPEIGWSIGGERSRCGRKLTYFTHGCFIRHAGQRAASHFDVVVVDEAHEQGVEAQMVLYLLRRSLATHGRPKIVVMSATMDAKELWNYFHEGLPEASRSQLVGNEHQVVDLGVRPHDVRVFRLEDLPGSCFSRDSRTDELCKKMAKHMQNGSTPC